MNTITLSISDFAKKNNSRNSGNSYTYLSDEELIELVISNWSKAIPGQSEKDLTRKILVNVPSKNFFCPPKMPIQLGMNIQSELKIRQEGEDPYVVNFISEKEAIKFGFKEIEANHVDIVCYHKDALLENNGKRSSESDWEIVAILATNGEYEPMNPLAMARNYLNKPGGTKTDYSAFDFAEAIYYWSCQKGISVKLSESNIDNLLYIIAKKYGIETLKSRKMDSLDFKEYSVETISSLMKDCVEAGCKL